MFIQFIMLTDDGPMKLTTCRS